MKNMQGMLKYLNILLLNMTSPNVKIALKICIACSNTNNERSFSVLKKVQNYLRLSLTNEKTSASPFLNIKNEIVRSKVELILLKSFQNLKPGKNPLFNLRKCYMT